MLAGTDGGDDGFPGGARRTPGVGGEWWIDLRDGGWEEDRKRRERFEETFAGGGARNDQGQQRMEGVGV